MRIGLHMGSSGKVAIRNRNLLPENVVILRCVQGVQRNVELQKNCV